MRAASCARWRTRPDQAGVGVAMAGYLDLCETYELPPADEVFAVGYDLPGPAAEPRWGHGVAQLVEGVQSGLPETSELMEEAVLWDAVRDFTGEDPYLRAPLARRFATWLAGHDPAVADIARLEAALRHAAPADLGELTLWAAETPARDALLRLAPGVEVVAVHHDCTGLIDPAEPLAPEPLPAPVHYAIHRGSGGQVGLGELSPAAATALDLLAGGPRPRASLQLDETELDTLLQLGLVLPAAVKLLEA